MAKRKLILKKETEVKHLLEAIQKQYQQYECNTIDGLKIELETGWIHLRSSNTEPVLRIYTENTSAEKANAIADTIIEKVNAYTG